MSSWNTNEICRSLNTLSQIHFAPKALFSQSPSAVFPANPSKKLCSIELEEESESMIVKSLPLPVLLNQMQSAISTDGSSTSSNCGSENNRQKATSVFAVPIFEEEIIPSATAAAAPSLGRYFNPTAKSASNEEIYFPRVFSQNMMDTQEPTRFLSRHEITPPMRARMIDWMIEVLKAYNYSETTFSLAVTIMDTYFAKASRTICIHELHIIGVTSMFIASKFEEIIPFSINKIYEKISHRKISISEIKRMEADIMQTLDFEIAVPTPAILTDLMVKFLETQEFFQTHSQQQKELFMQLSSYILKLTCFDYELISTCNSKIVAICGIFVTSIMMDRCFKVPFPSKCLHDLIQILTLDYVQLANLTQRIMTIEQTFQQTYPSLLSLKKHHLDGIRSLAARNNDQQRSSISSTSQQGQESSEKVQSQ